MVTKSKHCIADKAQCLGCEFNYFSGNHSYDSTYFLLNFSPFPDFSAFPLLQSLHSPNSRVRPRPGHSAPCSMSVAMRSMIASSCFFSGSYFTFRFMPKNRPNVCQNPARKLPKNAFTML